VVLKFVLDGSQACPNSVEIQLKVPPILNTVAISD